MSLSATDFWLKVKEYLAYKNLTQKELCKICHFNEGSFKNRIHNNTYPTIDEVYLIAKTLDVSIDVLTGLKQEPVSPSLLQFAKEVDRLSKKNQKIVRELVEILDKNS